MSGKAIIPTLAVLAVSLLSTSSALADTLGPTTLRDGEHRLGCEPGELIGGYHQNCTTMPTGAGNWGWELGTLRFGNKWSPASGVTVEEGQEVELIVYHLSGTVRNIECRTMPFLITTVNGHARAAVPMFKPCYPTGFGAWNEAPALNGSDFALPETPHGYGELVIG